MLESLLNLELLWYNTYIDIMLSEKATSADNQQERLKFEAWLTGFVDGEGSFLISIFRNKTTKSGWQIFPEFVITQGAKSLATLEEVRNYFKCGKVFINRRNDNHHEPVYRFCVRSLEDISEIIIPCFERNLLRTAKKEDFKKFKIVVEMMAERQHLTKRGWQKITKISLTMNRKGNKKL